MAKRNGTKGQTMIYKILHRKTNMQRVSSGVLECKQSLLQMWYQWLNIVINFKEK
jgi:hypothetical protein